MRRLRVQGVQLERIVMGQFRREADVLHSELRDRMREVRSLESHPDSVILVWSREGVSSRRWRVGPKIGVLVLQRPEFL